MTHLLLPFTHGVDAMAIDSAIALAHHLGVTIMPLSLIHLPDSSEKRRIRPGDVEQSIDFLEFALHKAGQAGVPIERVELRTHNSVRSIRAIAQEMECAVILFVQKGSGVLLATEEVNELLADRGISFYIMNLPPKKSLFSFPWRFSHSLRESRVVKVVAKKDGPALAPETKGSLTPD